MALTPNDVLNKQFQTTKFRDGYDQDEVDDFLDEVLAEFQRLIAENDQLKAQLSAAPDAAPAEAPVAPAGPVIDTAEADALRAQLADARAQLAAVGAQLAESQQALQTAQQQAAAGSSMLDGMNSAEYLQLARRVHEEHVREGVAKRDEAIAEGESRAAALLADAQAKHDQLVGGAQAQVSQLTTEAQSKADTLLSEAQAQADALLGEARVQRESQIGTLSAEVAALTAQRDELQTAVDGLKAFERDYRASLQSYLETQLGELQASTGSVPAAASAATEPVVEAFVPPFEPPAQTFGFDAPSVEPAVSAPEPPAATSPFDAPGTGAFPVFEAPASPFDAQSSFGAPEPTLAVPAVPASFEVPPVAEEVAVASAEAIQWESPTPVEEATFTEAPAFDTAGFARPAEPDFGTTEGAAPSLTYEIPGFGDTQPPAPPATGEQPTPGVGGN